MHNLIRFTANKAARQNEVMTNWHYSDLQTTGPDYNVEIDSKWSIYCKASNDSAIKICNTVPHTMLLPLMLKLTSIVRNSANTRASVMKESTANAAVSAKSITLTATETITIST